MTNEGKAREEAPHIQNRTRGTNEETTKPKSIIVSIKSNVRQWAPGTKDAGSGFILTRSQGEPPMLRVLWDAFFL